MTHIGEAVDAVMRILGAEIEDRRVIGGRGGETRAERIRAYYGCSALEMDEKQRNMEWWTLVGVARRNKLGLEWAVAIYEEAFGEEPPWHWIPEGIEGRTIRKTPGKKKANARRAGPALSSQSAPRGPGHGAGLG